MIQTSFITTILVPMVRGLLKLVEREAHISIIMVSDIIVTMARDQLRLEIRDVLILIFITTQHTITMAAHTLQLLDYHPMDRYGESAIFISGVNDIMFHISLKINQSNTAWKNII